MRAAPYLRTVRFSSFSFHICSLSCSLHPCRCPPATKELLMLTIQGKPQTTCDGWTRREILQAAGAGLLGVNLPKVLAAEQQQPGRTGTAKSVIFLFL